MTRLTAQTNKLLTDVSERRPLGSLVFNRILTPKKVIQYSGKIGSHGNDHLRLVNTIAGGENGYMRIDTQTKKSSSYQIETHALKDIITDEDYKNVEAPFDAQVDSTDALTDMMNLTKEYGLAQAMTDTAVLTQNATLSGTSQWSDYANSNPIADIVAGIKVTRIGCGTPASKAVCDYDVAQTLRFHPKVLADLGFNANKIGGATNEDLARVFGLREFIVADATFNNSKKGEADNMVPVWGKHFVLFHSEAKAAKKQTTLGYHLELGAGRKVVAKEQDEPIDSTKVMVEDKYEQLISNVGAGYLIKDAIA